MKHILALTFLFLALNFSFAQKVPNDVKTEFDQASLSQAIFDLEGNQTTVGEILKQHKGNVIFLDIWASWCPDCITGLPALREVQSEFPEVVYLFFSLDRIGKEDAWKNAIDKFNIEGIHYWFNTEWKNDFTEYIQLNWIPRYMIIDQEGKIAHYYAVKADDETMIKTLRELVSKGN